MQSQLNINNTYYNEMTFDLDQFMLNIFGEIMWFKDGKFCFNAGWQTEDILFTIETAMKFQDCYKVLI